jgi:NSS family neurotransmitter:Na+ symporter
MSERETWATRLGFILAAVGSAVGLGNIWQFPFRTAENGGAAFLVVYLFAVFLIGFPAMLAEFVVGRRAEHNPIDAFAVIGHRHWAVVGAIGSFIAFWILSFYSVVGGWVVRYLFGSATGAYFGDPAGYFGAISAGPEAVALHAVFLLLTVGIVAFGIEDGIELSTKLMVPSIVVLLVGLGLWASTLDGAALGYDYYLSPSLDVLTGNFLSILPYAVGQAFFTLSLGMGAMLTYSSYLGEDDDLPVDGGTIVILNTLVGVLAGFVVFPVLFSQGVEPGQGAGGAGAVFVTLAGAFANLPLGRWIGVGFFFVLLLAALSSAISLLEVVTSYITEHYRVGRPTTAAGLGVAIFLLGVPTALNTTTLGWYNDLAYNLLLPLSVFLLSVFVGWVWDGSLQELMLGTDRGDAFATVWVWFVKVVVPVAVLFTLGTGLVELYNAAVEQGLVAGSAITF